METVVKNRLSNTLSEIKNKQQLKAELARLSARIQKIESGIREFRHELKTMKRERSDVRRHLAKLTQGVG